MSLDICVVTISDRASRGEYEDRSGPEAEELLRELLSDVSVRRELVADEPERIADAIRKNGDCAAVITLGGTGIGPRDITPDVTLTLCDRELPGISEAIRAESLRETPYAMLSRGVAGMMGNCAVVNLPGSVRAAKLGIRVLAPVLGHIVPMAKGEGH